MEQHFVGVIFFLYRNRTLLFVENQILPAFGRGDSFVVGEDFERGKSLKVYARPLLPQLARNPVASCFSLLWLIWGVLFGLALICLYVFR